MCPLKLHRKWTKRHFTITFFERQLAILQWTVTSHQPGIDSQAGCWTSGLVNHWARPGVLISGTTSLNWIIFWCTKFNKSFWCCLSGLRGTVEQSSFAAVRLIVPSVRRHGDGQRLPFALAAPSRQIRGPRRAREGSAWWLLAGKNKVFCQNCANILFYQPSTINTHTIIFL